MSEKKIAGLYWTKEDIDSACQVYVIHIAVTGHVVCTIDTDVPGAEAFANLFAAAPKLVEALQVFVDAAPSEGSRCLYCNERVYVSDSDGEHSPDCEMVKGWAALDNAKGKA